MNNILIKYPLILLPFVSSLILSSPAEAQFTLSIFHNNDGESQLLQNGNEGGAASFITLLNSLKAQANADPNIDATLTLSSGDNFLAGPEFNASLTDGIFYDVRVLNAIGYDAIALGNHDFDFGPDLLANFISSPDFSQPVPFLGANLDFSGEPSLQALVDSGRIAASTIVNKGGEDIGIIGAITPSLPAISSPGNVLINPDLTGIIQTEINALEALGVNKIILISHLQSINEELALIPQLSGIDVVIAGGGDDLLANPSDPLLPSDQGSGAAGLYPLTALNLDGITVPVVTTAGEYKYIGQLEVTFDNLGEVIGFQGGPVRNFQGDPNTTPDPTIVSTVVDPVQASIDALDANVIATSEVDLNGRRGSFSSGEPGVRTVETNQGNLIADAILWQATQLAPSLGLPTPNVALQNGGGIRNNSIIAAGDITELDTFDMLPFSNFLSIVPDISPTQFKEILENAVSRVQNTDGRFAQIAGFEFIYDISATAQTVDNNGNVLTPGDRIRSVQLSDGTVIVENGTVVAGAPNLNIATIDFLARGGDQYPLRGASFTNLGVSYQQALANYITQELQGQILASQYPEGGSGRILEIQQIPTPVPEPSALLGLLFMGGTAILVKKKG
ncbi:5'-Nucleotidase domain protein [Rippkaea orientalis PCC 8801]|uniref:5'-Nucleotidase domain protein n=1 Tax=Rippkaea orientalis (strain PCC 8801 / RF-1) TaxID=41431 RepID=B7JYN7_RIPO1|nr:5'-nucleotidase C-terminal domain-containing protein [Rippkaea orientalis]ACK64907.1 5'-Nucleotidase domain protein [Rippkaea orientalis PCC 8801]